MAPTSVFLDLRIPAEGVVAAVAAVEVEVEVEVEELELP